MSGWGHFLTRPGATKRSEDPVGVTARRANDTRLDGVGRIEKVRRDAARGEGARHALIARTPVGSEVRRREDGASAELEREANQNLSGLTGSHAQGAADLIIE